MGKRGSSPQLLRLPHEKFCSKSFLMSNAADQSQEAPKENPLSALCIALDGDMRAVNALILTRMESNVPLIPQLASYLIAAGGKRVRPLLTLAATALYSGDMSRAALLATSVEFIHTATLLHDDVVDGSDQRRGQEAANLVFGNQASVLVGDFLFSRAFQLMTEDGNLDVLRILSDASAVIAQGEVMQLSLAGKIDTGMGSYLEIIKAKTAALFAAACEVGPVIAGADRAGVSAMAEFGMNLGIAFQIADDTLDYNADREKLGKTVGDDFREGKLTAPVILALEKADGQEREFWQRTMGAQDQKDGDLQHALALFAKHGTLEASMEMAREYADNARMALAEAPDHPLRAILDDLCGYVISRDH